MKKPMSVLIRLMAGAVVLGLMAGLGGTVAAGTFDLWSHRMAVTFSGYDKPGTLTNFPALVVLSTNITGFAYDQFESATGADLRFAASNETTELNYEIESWNTNGTSYVWVQVPELVDTNSLIYAYWGEASATQPSYTTNGATWSAGFQGVWHMQNATNVLDSSGNANHGTGSTGIGSTTAGIAGNALSLNGSSHYVDCGAVLNMRTNSNTISIWFKTSTATFDAGFLGKTVYGSVVGRYGLLRSGANLSGMAQFSGGQVVTSHAWNYSDGVWHQATVTFDRTGNMTVYVDGVQKSSDSISAHSAYDMNPATLRFFIGAYGNSAGTGPQALFYYPGQLDEARVMNVAVSSNWVWACRANQTSNQTLLSYSGVLPQSTDLTVQALPATSRTATSAVFNGSLGQVGGAEDPDVYFCWGYTDAGTNSGTSVWANVTYAGAEWGMFESFSTNITGLISGSNYIYRAYATNSTGFAWSEDAHVFQTVTLPAVTNLGPVNGAVASVLRGEVTDTGTDSPDVRFLWWEAVAAVTSTVPMGVLQAGEFSTAVGGLDAGKTYHYRIAASNAAGTVWSHTEAFWSVPGALYVSTNGNGSVGASWDTAFTNLHDALAVAASNDTIYLAGQTFAVTQQLAWTLSGLTLEGGYAATNNADTPGPRDPDAWQTVITRNTNFGNMRLVYLKSVTNATLDGITFQGGSHAADLGGGLYLESVTGLQLRNARVHNNYVGAAWGANAYGGGLYAKTVSGLISNVVFSANWAQGSGAHNSGNGGGAYIEGGALTLRDTAFLGNTAHGGGSAHGYGGAVFFYSGSHTMRNALLVHNRGVYGGDYIAPSVGGGLYVRSGVTLVVDNATVYGNTSDGIHNLSAGTTVRNSIFYRNRPDIGGTPAPTQSNNLTGTDPLFDDNWFYLSADSPAINAGDRSVADAGLTGYTTRADGTADTGNVDLGYHYPSGLPAFEQWYVSRNNGNDAWDGTGWGMAFRSLTHALNQAGDRAIIHVEAGTYTNGTETFPLMIRDRTVQIVGTNAELTVINAASTATSVFDVADVWGDNRIEGLTIRGGIGGTHGGGLLIRRSRLTIEGCRIMHNSAAGLVETDIRAGGGGIRAEQSAIAFNDCEIANNGIGGSYNAYGRGAGMYAVDVTGYVRDSLFTNNSAQGGSAPDRAGYGGAVFLVRAFLEVENSRFIGNNRTGGKGSAYGGAIYVVQGAPVLRNLLIADNTASSTDGKDFGSGLYVANSGTPTIENCTIVTNRKGGGLYGFDANLTIVNTILWTNTPVDFTNLTAAAFSYSRADGLTPGVQGNITDDPLFIDPAAGNYGLQSTFGQYDEADTNTVIFQAANSPCMDTGTNRVWMTDESLDIRGFPRVHHGNPYLKTDPRVDMGAYEVWSPPPVPLGTMFLFQ